MAVEKERVAGSAFGVLLRRHRLAAGLSQEALAELARMSVNGIGALERGDRQHPYHETVVLLAEALSLSPAAAAEFEAAAARPRHTQRRVDLRGVMSDEHVWTTNLPNQRTSLVGRETEIAEIVKMLRYDRLVSITGSGGVGKTRAALAVGDALGTDTMTGVWLVELAPVAAGSLVATAVAQALHIQESPNCPLIETLLAYLRQKSLLLVLDNCEHVIGEAAALADALLRGCPNLRILAATREPLRISGERMYRLPSLRFPAPTEIAGLSAADAAEYAAVVLFAERAQAIDRGFGLSDDNAPIVAEICRRLDGIPLAIELAAARVKVLSVPNLAERLNQRFKILTGGSRLALPRQRTLGALIDWSYDLLTLPEQVLFRRLGIFAGGFGLDAAAAVCGLDGEDELDVLDLLTSLNDKSLVVADTIGERERYHLLESTRAYALAKLSAIGEEERLARRHGEYFRDRAYAADTRFGNGSTVAWLASVEVELDNYRAALDWALTNHHDVILGATLAGSLMWLWTRGGLSVEGRYWIARARSSFEESAMPELAARLWRTQGLISDGREKHDCAERALTLYRSVGDAHGAARSLLILGFAFYQMGKLEESHESYASALPVLRECADRSGVAWCLSHQAEIYRHGGEIRAARERFAEALASYKSLEDEYGTAMVLGDLAELEFADGRVERALELADEGLEDYAGRKRGTNVAQARFTTITFQALTFTSATCCIALGQLERACELTRDGLRLARKAESMLGIAVAIQLFALLGALRGAARDAARLIGYVNFQLAELRCERGSTEKWCFERLMARLRENLTEVEIEMLENEGASWPEDRAIEVALRA